MSKTKEILKNLLLPTTLSGIERVLSAKLLGVWLQSDLGIGIHVDNIAKIYKQRLYLLTQLRKQGLSQRLLKLNLKQSFSHELHMLRLPGEGMHPGQTLT